MRPEDIVIEGQAFVWVTNTDKGDYFHLKYQELAERGYQIHFSNKAFDYMGNRMTRRHLAIYVLDEQLEEVERMMDQITETPIEKALWSAMSGDKHDAYMLLKDLDIPEDKKREILALAYIYLARLYRRVSMRELLFSRDDRNRASRYRRYAKRLVKGTVPFELMEEDRVKTPPSCGSWFDD